MTSPNSVTHPFPSLSFSLSYRLSAFCHGRIEVQPGEVAATSAASAAAAAAAAAAEQLPQRARLAVMGGSLDGEEPLGI